MRKKIEMNIRSYFRNAMEKARVEDLGEDGT
jgi:hypothetical protein